MHSRELEETGGGSRWALNQERRFSGASSGLVVYDAASTFRVASYGPGVASRKRAFA